MGFSNNQPPANFQEANALQSIIAYGSDLILERMEIAGNIRW